LDIFANNKLDSLMAPLDSESGTPRNILFLEEKINTTPLQVQSEGYPTIIKSNNYSDTFKLSQSDMTLTINNKS
jgi:hypothetical protein